MSDARTKAKLELILERRNLREVLARLEALGIRGWTVLAVDQGRGRHGRWHGSELSGTSEHVLLFAVCEGGLADRVAESLGPDLERLAAVLLRSEVQVHRPDRF